MKTDFLIIGTGFYGSVIGERISNVLNKSVLFLEKRNHIGGNCYSLKDKMTGIEYHKYGTHIFHTSNENVWNYISNFTKFNNYKHQVLAQHKNRIFQLPINLETINSFFNKNLKPREAIDFIKNKIQKEKINTPNNFEEKAKSMIGSDLYNAFIKNYTIKQWGMNPKNLNQSIFSRLPIRFNYLEDYFNHCKYQGIPLNGYTEIFEKMLSSPKIRVELNTDYFRIKEKIKVKYLTIYTGPIDRFFNYQHGRLGWRSVKFENSVINVGDYQGTSVINYPDLKFKFTRIHEPKHLHLERNYVKNKTLIIKEYALDDNLNPYYPINSPENSRLIKIYKENAKKIKDVIFGGRLADYAYYDMDMTISAALVKFNKIKSSF
jgi:UDP-galactopyranose mutase